MTLSERHQPVLFLSPSTTLSVSFFSGKIQFASLHFAITIYHSLRRCLFWYMLLSISKYAWVGGAFLRSIVFCILYGTGAVYLKLSPDIIPVWNSFKKELASGFEEDRRVVIHFCYPTGSDKMFYIIRFKHVTDRTHRKQKHEQIYCSEDKYLHEKRRRGY